MSLDTQCVLITGGCGFVGSWLVAEILQQTTVPRIVVLDNLRNGHRKFLPTSPRLTLHQADLTDAQAVLQVVESARPDLVFHLAALHYIPYCNAHPGETMEVNVVGTQHLLEACRIYQPDAMVIASSAAIYPILDGPSTEESSPGPTDIYGLSKWINEQQLKLFASQTQTRCAAARIFNVFGPHETNPHVIPEILSQMLNGKTQLALGNVKPKRDFIYVTDVARALRTLAENNTEVFRVFNVGTGQEFSIEDIVTCLAHISGQELSISTAADRVRPSDRMHLLCDPQRITQETKWQPLYTLDTGLHALWQDACENMRTDEGS